MSLLERSGVIWLDGIFVPWQDARVHVLTHSLHYGVGVFEGVRAYASSQSTAIFRLQDHTKRLFRSAKMLKMNIPYLESELNHAQLEIIRKNKLTAAYLRPMVFYGAEYLGLSTKNLSTHVMIAAWAWESYVGEEKVRQGIRICTASFLRHHPNSVLCKAKASGNYINSILALQEAQAAGFDETLFLDQQGFICEGSAQNIFIVAKGKLLTPELTSALDGITRDSICSFAEDIGLTVIEKRITRDEMYIADEAFFTGTASEITPIREIDGRVIGEGKPGPITQQLQQLYLTYVCGECGDNKGWLTFI